MLVGPLLLFIAQDALRWFPVELRTVLAESGEEIEDRLAEAVPRDVEGASFDLVT